jgi:hypothetical protein
MDERAKGTGPQTGDALADAGEAAMAETVEHEVDSSARTIAPKVGGSQTPGDEQSDIRTQAAPSGQSKPHVDAYARKTLAIKKKKKAAHRRRLKASHTKG